jgi:hypothetical protein
MEKFYLHTLYTKQTDQLLIKFTIFWGQPLVESHTFHQEC